MTVKPSPLTNGASWPRELKPTVLMVVHITSNMGTAAQQVHYANRPGSGGPSAHDYLDPDGSGIEALDPAKRCAWSNGDVQSPNLKIPTVKAAVDAHVNPNRVCWREVECVGDGAHPVTDAQLEQVARFVAADSRATGLPVNRSTVTTHADWNTVTRNSCAFPPSVREARLAFVISRARAILAAEEVPVATTTDWAAAVAKIRGYVGVYLALPSLNDKQRAALMADLKTLDADLAGLEASLRSAPAPAAPVAAPPAASAPVAAPADADPYYGLPALEGQEASDFGQAHAAEIDAAAARFIPAQTAVLVAEGKPAGVDGAERGSTTREQSIAIAHSVGASILTRAGWFGPEPAPGVSA